MSMTLALTKVEQKGLSLYYVCISLIYRAIKNFSFEKRFLVLEKFYQNSVFFNSSSKNKSLKEQNYDDGTERHSENSLQSLSEGFYSQPEQNKCGRFRDLFYGGDGGTCFPQYLGMLNTFFPPKFMANSRTLSLLFEFAADVFSEIII